MRFPKPVVVVAACATALVGAAWMIRGRSLDASAPSPASPSTSDSTPSPGEAPAPASADSREIIARQASPSIMMVESFTPEGDRIAGTGFVVDPHGLVATNAHLIDGAAMIQVGSRATGPLLPVGIIGLGGEDDLVLLVLSGSEMPALELRDGAPEIGSSVTTIGFPHELAKPVADGSVLGIRRLDDGRTLIETSVAISAGHSGGPLVDRDGKVLGLVTARLPKGLEGQASAIPSSRIRALLTHPSRMIRTKDFFETMRTSESIAEAWPTRPRPSRDAEEASEARDGWSSGTETLTGTWFTDVAAFAVIEDDGTGTIRGKIVWLEERDASLPDTNDIRHERVAQSRPLRLSADERGTHVGAFAWPWSCQTTALVRQGGTFKHSVTNKPCEVEVALRVQRVSTMTLRVETARPALPDAGSPTYERACETCLVGADPEISTGTWTRISETALW